MKQPSQPVRSMNIYDNKVDIVHPKLKSYDTRKILNDYQSFPKDTKFCQCHYNDKSDDTWNYYLREIVNPDQAISKFFITIRNEPFFVSTKLDEENKCMKDLIIRTHRGEDVSIKELAETIAKVTGYPGEICWDVSKPDGTPKRPLDYTKLLEKGWKPNHKLLDGLRKTYEWYIANTDIQTR